VYVEYSGTALMDIFKGPKQTDRDAVLARVRADYEKIGLRALSALGYENNFALVIRKQDADRFELSRISDLSRVQSQFRAGMFGEFLERADGFPGLARAYLLRFAHPPAEMDLGLLYQALESGQIDLAVGSTTDGLIAAKGFVVLEDDRSYFPPYDALPVARQAALAQHPAFGEAMDMLAGRIDAATMRRLNFEVDGRKRNPRDVARDYVATLLPRASP
jgi:glycine betaine/choline ABC-type transport system substrate-binding protein